MRYRRRSDSGEVQRARGLAFACAASAGAHAGLVPAHLNGEPRLGAAFLVAVVLLVAAAAAIVARPWDRRITSAAGALLAGLMLAYLATRTTANPKFWSLAAMRTMMRVHLNQVVALAVDQIKGKYGIAIKLYDTYIHHILVGMADMLSNRIIQQFRARFR